MIRRVAIGLLALLAGGCTVIQPADQAARAWVARAAPALAEPVQGGEVSWPARWGDGTAGLAEGGVGGKGVIVELEGPAEAWRGARLGRFHHLRADDEDREMVARLAWGRETEAGYSYKMEGPSSFVFVRRAEDEAGGDGTPVFSFVSATPTETSLATGVQRVEVQRTWFTLNDPIGRDAPRGLIVFNVGLFGAPEPVIDDMVRRLRVGGWAVLRMLAPPSRLTERVEVVVDVAGSLEAEAERTAELLDQRTAEAAYAAEAALAHTLARRPELAPLPRVFMGLSAGAMTGPATVARIHGSELGAGADGGLGAGLGEFDAAVLIGGGAGNLSIAARSSYAPFVDGVIFRWMGEDGELSRPGPVVERLERLYLEHSTLDAYHTASALEGVPTLMIHASGDTAVPADSGDLLWERLGRPERWVSPLGHAVLFLTINLRTGGILDWIDETLEAENGERGE